VDFEAACSVYIRFRGVNGYHSSKDKPKVEWLAEQLQKQGLRPFLDKWDLQAGRSWRKDLEAALANSKSLFQKPMLWSVSVVACTETDPGTSPRSADGASTESC